MGSDYCRITGVLCCVCLLAVLPFPFFPTKAHKDFLKSNSFLTISSLQQLVLMSESHRSQGENGQLLTAVCYLTTQGTNG